MKVSFSEIKPPTSHDEIVRLEKMIGLEFPEEYQKHLLKFNGGRCKPNIFHFVEGNKHSRSMIDWFYAIYDGKHNNLLNVIAIYKMEAKRIPFRMVPIAHDPGGNLVCISCSGSDLGSIYFWDHENEGEYVGNDIGEVQNMHFVANSFDDFLKMLDD